MSAKNASDPRVDRTRTWVLHHARLLVAERGVDALTYTALARECGVTRQTLYRHWPTVQLLRDDMLHSGPDTDYPVASDDAATVLSKFLRSLRDGMEDPGLSGTMASLIGDAERNQSARATLTSLVVERTNELNRLFQPQWQLSVEDTALLMGPIMYCRFVARIPVPDALIDEVVYSALARHAHQRRHF